jgi:hypothetical protein
LPEIKEEEVEKWNFCMIQAVKLMKEYAGSRSSNKPRDNNTISARCSIWKLVQKEKRWIKYSFNHLHVEALNGMGSGNSM